MQKKFLTGEWKDLIMVNYPVDPAILQPYLPFNTSLDFYEGQTFVSLIGFMFANTKVRGFSIPYHINFEEVNLRFYVTHTENGMLKRGVVFISEIVPSPAINLIANTIYREKYRSMPMKHFYKVNENEILLGYHWKYRGTWNRLEAKTEVGATSIIRGSIEEYITEHYWGYSKYDDRTTYEYGVLHPVWDVLPVKEFVVDCNFKSLYGNHFSFLDNAKPHSVFVACGSEISILRKRIIR